MASKKGIIITIGMLVAITSASFLIWFLPENNEIKFIVSDFDSHLDGVKNIHGVIRESVDIEFQNLFDEKISSEEYIELAKASSSQINSQIIELVESKATEEWLESYINYIESLRQYNSYIRETIVAASMIEEGIQSNEMEGTFQKLTEFKINSESLIIESDNTRP